jgi:hypothetical protein
MTENQDYKPMTANEQKLVAWVVEHCEQWRNYRDTNFLPMWKEYERIFRGQWDANDKTRDSERSKFISPATQQAVETRHTEIMEAIFGNGEWFDLKDDDKMPLDVMKLKEQLRMDFECDGIEDAVDEIVLMGEIYGTGIGEVLVKEEATYKPATQPIPGTNQAAFGVLEGKRFGVKLAPVNPKNFLIDPNAARIEDALGVAIEKPVAIHKIVEGIESGIYTKREVESLYTTTDLEPTQEKTQANSENAVLIKYFGLVPRALLEPEDEQVVELFPHDHGMERYTDMVEAIIVIANGSVLLKAEENPLMMRDRSVVAYQADTVPGRFWGRGTVEKAYNTQKAIDGTLRADMDSRALTTAPMVAMDATRLPRGAKFEVKPGKALLTNGNPAEIMMPFSFGAHNAANADAAQNFERMLNQATATVDSAGMPSNMPRDGGEGAMSMAMAGIIKKYKRTLRNFQSRFLMPFVNKAVWRYMQFDPQRYPAVDMTFVPTGALGIIAREYEQSQLINLLKTLGPDTPVMPVILKGILSNSSLQNKSELLEALDAMSQPNPEQEQMAAAQAQAQIAMLQAQVSELESKTVKNQADARKAMVEAEVKPLEAQAKVVAALSNNLDEDNEAKDFERRAKVAELMLKEQEIDIKRKDIESNERIAAAQMNTDKSNQGTYALATALDGFREVIKDMKKPKKIVRNAEGKVEGIE